MECSTAKHYFKQLNRTISKKINKISELRSCTGVTGQMMSDVLFFVSCIEIILCIFAVMRFHILMFLVKDFSDFSSRYC